MNRFLICLLVSGLTFPTVASEPTPGTDEPNKESTIEIEDEQREDENLSKEPSADELRNRDLGDAFKNFRPSEEISADNAVGFPVDI